MNEINVHIRKMQKRYTAVMAYKNVYQKLGHRVSEEFQLLAEEKWIIETLTKIKNQRNCLQIERLHLESMKAKVKGSTNKVGSKCSAIQEDPVPSTSTVNLMQNFTVNSAAEQNETVERRLDDATCNEEELNLVVTNSVFNTDVNSNFNIEEDEDEESDDDMFIDMNMLMNGVFK